MAAKSDKSTDKPEEKKPYTIIDVNHPGKSPAEASGVPVIVTNRPVLKDPMVVDNDDEVKTDEPEGKDTIVGRSKKLKIQPIDSEEKPSRKAAEPEKDSKKTIAEIAVEADAKAEEKTAKADKVAKEAPKESEPVEEKPVEPDDEPEPDNEPEPEAEPKAEPEPDKPAESEPKSDDEAGELAEDTDADPKDAEAARKAAEKQLALNKLAESGTYSLPINAVEKRRVKRFALITVVLLLLLGIVWVDLALDAQLIQINGVNAPTDFFPDR